jgi:hypothetical protein
MMPGGACSLFTDKVLLVEGAQDAIVSGHLDRLAAIIKTTNKDTEYFSFSSLGWSILETRGAKYSLEHVKLLLNLGKRVATLFDGDGAGKETAVKVKDLCPTFIYKSEKESNPTLEHALLMGLPEDHRKQVLTEFYSGPGCASCDSKETDCWVLSKTCNFGSKNDRKQRIQDLSLKCYQEKLFFPKAFEELWANIENTEPGMINTLPIDLSE